MTDKIKSGVVEDERGNRTRYLGEVHMSVSPEKLKAAAAAAAGTKGK